MKQLSILCASALAAALLCGCGGEGGARESAQVAAGTVEVAAAAAGVQAPAETEAPAAAAAAPAPAETEAPAAEERADLLSVAKGFEGADVEALYAAIGYPDASDYASSCLGDGEDGNLYYDGFVVYTYRENGAETVNHVE